jgi:HEAT repeat protein
MVHANAEALIRLLPYGQWNVEGGREVLRALESLGEGAVATLSRTLADPGRARFLRLAAAWLLGRIGTPTARAALLARCDDSDLEVANAIHRALGGHPRLPAAA